MRLRSRYTASILGLAAAIILIGGAAMLVQLHGAIGSAHETSAKIVYQALTRQLDQRGRNQVELLGSAMANALFRDDIDTIRDIARPANQRSDVAYFHVLDREGVVIHDGTDTLEAFGQSPDDSHQARMAAELATVSWIDGDVMHFAAPVLLDGRLIGSVRMGTPLAVIAPDLHEVAASYDTAGRASLQSALLRFGILAAVIVIAAVVVGSILARQLSEPILALSRAAKSIGRGEYEIDLEDMDEVNEVGDLARSFRAMAGNLKDTTVSRAYLDSVLNSMIDPLLVIDEIGSIRLLNPAACRMLGAGRGKLIGRPVDAFLNLADSESEAAGYNLEDNKNFRAIDGYVTSISGRVVPVLVSKARISDGLVITLRDIADRLRFEQTLRRAKDEAESASRTKSRFLAVMSHELRTPLNAIIGFSEVIRDRLLGDGAEDRYRAYAADIHSSGQHLLELINDILDISKVEAGQMQLRMSEVDVKTTVQQVVELCSGNARHKGISLEIDMPQDVIRMKADTRAVKQILFNLLSNAVKFTPDLGMVTVTAWQSGVSTTLTVTDTGVGIPRDALARITQPFVQVDNRFDTASEGTGLGLALVRQLVELHGGSLDIDSEVGVGTTVRVRFPQSPAEAKPGDGEDKSGGDPGRAAFALVDMQSS